MNPITDELGEEAIIVQHNAEDSWFAVVDRAHRIEGVSRAVCTSFYRGQRLCG